MITLGPGIYDHINRMMIFNLTNGIFEILSQKLVDNINCDYSKQLSLLFSVSAGFVYHSLLIFTKCFISDFPSIAGFVHLLVHRVDNVSTLRLLLPSARVKLLRRTAPRHDRKENLLPGNCCKTVLN